MKTIVALLAFAACASAGIVAPAVYHAHAPAFLAAPVVKHVHPAIYAVQPPVVVSKAVYHDPVVKVLHAPAPVVKTISYGPIAYGAYGLHHHHHHGHFF